ncbi:MAG TPA: aminotransferase class I/II-fold pyridoxal phosphate-dependent enzyme, partial [bacterium]|nr:aminotransferase class I/II-fold pyridoxal phosphate-dependent enzyme [bacterium]
SLSKGYNMTGWRIGWAVGRTEFIKALGVIKSNTDSGVFNAIQEASIVGLDLPFSAQDHIRDLYRSRRDRVLLRLEAAGFEFYPCRGTIYVWGKVPTTESSVEYASRLLQETGVVVGPGRGWGPSGEGYFRLCLTTPDGRLDEAIGRIVADAEKRRSA